MLESKDICKNGQKYGQVNACGDNLSLGKAEMGENFMGTTHGGKSVKEWASLLGVTPGSIYNRLQRGWTWEQVIATPQLRGKQVLTPAAVVRIRERKNERVKRLAREFGVSIPTIRDIWDRRTWTDLPDRSWTRIIRRVIRTEKRVQNRKK